MRYGIGDIVKLNDGKNKMEYFIIVDMFLEFVEDSTSPVNLKVDSENTRYTAMQMYPVEKEQHMLLRYTEDRFETVAFVGQKQHESIVELINRERFRVGKTGKPFYEDVIKKRLNDDTFDKFVSKVTKKKGKKKKIQITDDVIQYDKLGTIDECLDAMNDLSELHKQFGDESYLQLREVVVGRLRDIADIQKKARSIDWDAIKKK
ncbi:hypothetical protein [Bacillus phage vB_BanS-Thrax5]|nr:hypothetical protein [Bacillus phage vB_BanS-Thrax5]